MSGLKLRRLDTRNITFDADIETLLARKNSRDVEMEESVRAIIAAVQQRGDSAVLEYCRRFDGLDLASEADLQVPVGQMEEAYSAIPVPLREALEESASRIETYHRQQRPVDWRLTDDHGNRLGQLVRPLTRVGIYVPGGRASYPSSVLMNAIPARVAGVTELLMCVPARDGQLADVVLAAAYIAGVDHVFTIGGAQAIAAMAYGTSIVSRVDKIVGPGNRYVAEAKRQVYGQVGLDMLAGPSEVLVISDGLSEPEWVALDLFAQAEHDEQAQALLLSPDAGFLDRVEASISELLPSMARRKIIEKSLGERGALIKVTDLDEALALSNRIAPEHLELSVEDPGACLDAVQHAGAIFLGRYSAEAIGDYCAGPCHVLPTSGSARFASPLDVNDFVKRSSIIECTPDGASRLAALAATIADSEGLDAHARSARCRLDAKRGS